MLLPRCPFLLFGMGTRRKLLYAGGALRDALTGESVRAWPVVSAELDPSNYRAELQTRNGEVIAIAEDERGIWLTEGGDVTCLAKGEAALPRFEGHRQAPLLRVLHHEILTNLLRAGPVPNLLVYAKPWYRDGAMVCMCLQKTGNLHLAEHWIGSLREPFDRNNAGICEPDNLGQALYLISLVSDSSHPLVGTILRTLPEVRRGNHIVGLTDGREHPVYQTKWLKFGLARLGLEDEYEIPPVYDDYSALFWMDYRDAHLPGPRLGAASTDHYPYLGWAEAHFYGDPPPMHLAGEGYPLTWEAHASEARYEGMALVSSEYVERRICAPHSWHAAEMFLYLSERP